jgi:hypothetical protein
MTFGETAHGVAKRRLFFIQFEIHAPRFRLMEIDGRAMAFMPAAVAAVCARP